MGLSSMLESLCCRLKFSHAQKCVQACCTKFCVFTFNDLQQCSVHPLTCKADIRLCVVFFCECRLTSEIHKNVSTENIIVYTVHKGHVFLHVSCMKAYMIRVWHKTCMIHAQYEACSIDECMTWSTHDSCIIRNRSFYRPFR